MAEEDDAQKTEDPTEKKLSKAREKGQVAMSQEIKSWSVLLAGAMGVVFMSTFMANEVRGFSLAFIEKAHMLPVEGSAMQDLLMETALKTGIALGPLALLLLVFALAGNMLQTGLLYAPSKIKPELSKISPMKGIKRMFSMKSMVEFGKGIAKLLIVAVISIGLTIPLLGDVELLPGASMTDIMDRVYQVAVVISLATVGVMTAIAGLDWAYQKYHFTKEMRMSKQEVKDEHKQAEGDPQVKGRIRAMRQQRARERMMAAVPEADVVITNPTHYAIALQYDAEEMPAPKLIAKGVDNVAFRIREVAEEHDIPIVENPPLARALYASVDLDEQIPPEHFVAVAEVIGYVMRLKGKTLH